MANNIAAVIVLAVAVLIYFVPAIVAYARKKRDAMSITMLNLFLGWSLVGWVIAFVWALKVDLHRRSTDLPADDY